MFTKLKQTRSKQLRVTRQLAMLATGGIALQSTCLGQVENALDLITAPSAIGNALVLPYSPFLDAVEFLVRFWF